MTLKIFFPLFVFFLHAQQPERMPQPDFAIEKQTHDFGKFPKTEMQEHTFRIKNIGDAPLVLLQITTGCGCTTVEHTPDTIAPGKKAKVCVRYDGSGQHTGYFRKSITFYTNAPRSYGRLFIQGETTE